jgi:two-component system, LytTR family, response regulator AlgR
MPKDLSALIVDDEPLAIERLQILCAKMTGLALAGTASDGAAALRLIGALKPDLLLLDIQMPGVDGLAVARALEDRDDKPAVVFTTAFDQFAVAAFDVAAVDYLLKPVSEERLSRAIERVRLQMETVTARPLPSPWKREFWVPHRGEIIRVPSGDIDLIEAERDYMRLHVGPRSYLLHETITELERKLDPQAFVRIHRSTIVRRDRVVGFKHDGTGGWRTELADGKVLRVGRSYLANARAMVERS